MKHRYYSTSQETQMLYNIFMISIFGLKSSLSSSPSDIKNLCKKIPKTLRRAIELNLVTDKGHYKLIEKSLEKLDNAFKFKDAGKKHEDFEPLFIIGLIELIFLLLGDLPNNWRKKSTSNDNSYLLNRKRSFYYNQSIGQKINVMAEAHQEKKEFVNKIKWWELSGKFKKEHPRVKRGVYSQEFLIWYSKKYPLLYSQLF